VCVLSQQILVHIAREGVVTTDLFRTPGNVNEVNAIMKKLNNGQEVEFKNYKFYTLASVIKVNYINRLLA
jgi:hypothetical protein